jgi:CHASE3 domain sensor protein
MNGDAVIDPPETFTAIAVPLLREYHEKLQQLHEQLRTLKALAVKSEYGDDTRQIVIAEHHAIDEFFKRFRPGARSFAQQVSGMIDQGKLTPLERAELRLRLSEFESDLLEFPALIAAYRPS